MFDALLTTDVVDGPVIVTVLAVAAVAAAFLLARRPSLRWLVTALSAVAAGLVVSVGIWLVAVRWLDLFGTSLGLVNYAWITATCCAVALAVVNLWRSPRWRKIVAVACIPVFIAAGTLAVNATYGINRTLGNLLSISTDKPIRLTPPTAASGYDTQLWKHWKPPADLPEHGRTGSQVIPNGGSGFSSRPAGIYLPPAALVEHPPPLPLVVMLMGQPGNPDPYQAAAVLDPIAAKHGGLAPIVIVADQLGDPLRDPLCLDTKRFGNAQTFLTGDVIDWAQKHLNITHDRRFWTIAGYSNGGQCALSIAVKRPDLFSNLIDISGEEFPGSDHEAAVLHDVFGGDKDAYENQKPLRIMHGKDFRHTTAVFTVGSDDAMYRPVALRVAAAARQVGMNVDYHEVPNGGHVQKALTGGLQEGFRVLYPVLGLSAPS
ncbi:hypothetical protein ASE16_03845 [Leifsonia sp. Root227]|uniref:alpha/beta hydrolase n=1 Tax=Leifsonia sp. Root227 TaxID=1736496 RepID=UPI0006F754F6|nr:alpha/beta hydrolase-fold protein [Leifsonia sp. Root227]KRC52187.1 hypothetical protein ASE16_03845 [Leifsonia sp. Root227]